MPKKKMPKSQELSINHLLILLSLVIIIPIFSYFYYRLYTNGNGIASFLTIPLILGIIFENRRLSGDWSSICLKIAGAVVLSLFMLLPSGRETSYNFEENIIAFTYCFIFLFILFSIGFHEEKVTAQLSEGIMLLKSVAIIYWIIDIGFFNYQNGFTYFLISIGLPFSILAFFHAFTYTKLTQNTRFWLSIWSCLIMITFAMEYAFFVFTVDHYTDYQILNNGLLVLQYFLLGISAMYMVQNAIMLLTYLPSRSSFYGKAHRKEIRAMNKKHIARFSKEQVKITEALLILLFTIGIYYCNYAFKIMPRGTAIWLVFFLTPYLIQLKNKIV